MLSSCNIAISSLLRIKKKTHFFLRLFFSFWVKITPQKTCDSKSHFWTVSSQSTNTSSSSSSSFTSVVVHKQTPLFLDSKDNDDFSETKGNDDQKKRRRARSFGRFCGVGFGRRAVSFLKTFVRFFPRERERERSRKRSDRAKNDAAR